MTDRIVLAGMAFHERHGVNEREKVEPQRYEVDVELEVDTAAAGRTDDLAETVDYRDVHAAVRAVLEGPSVDLIETLAESIAERLLRADARVGAVVVRVRKPEVRLGGPLEYAAVEIRRARDATEASGA
jgi:dihydroneopterin aldolase